VAHDAKLSKPPIRFRVLDTAKVFPPPLTEACLLRIAKAFLEYDAAQLKKLKPSQMKFVYEHLDLGIPISEAATRIADEDYWKRRMLTTRANCQVREHGLSWKQAYLEYALGQRLEALEAAPKPEDIEAVRQQVVASKGHIFQLKVNELPSHADLSFVFDHCPALCTLQITYGHKRLGMDYERAMFGMKISDAQILARNFCVSQTLVSVSLPSNMVDDELVKILMHGLQFAHMLTYLDLSHNKICDRGARRLASLLDPEFALHTLVLADNQIHANGCMHLGAHLADNETLECLDLRLNRCEDNGVSHLFQDICVNKYLKELNLACNDLTIRCMPYLASMLNDTTTLRALDLSANPLYVQVEPEEPEPEGEEPELPAGIPLTTPGLEHLNIDRDSPVGIFITCVERNPSLTKIDLRRCTFPPEVEDVLTTMVKHRELNLRGIPVDAYEQKRKPPAPVEGEEVAEEKEGEGEEKPEDGSAVEGEKAHESEAGHESEAPEE